MGQERYDMAWEGYTNDWNGMSSEVLEGCVGGENFPKKPLSFWESQQEMSQILFLKYRLSLLNDQFVMTKLQQILP